VLSTKTPPTFARVRVRVRLRVRLRVRVRVRAHRAARDHALHAQLLGGRELLPVDEDGAQRADEAEHVDGDGGGTEGGVERGERRRVEWRQAQREPHDSGEVRGGVPQDRALAGEARPAVLRDPTRRELSKAPRCAQKAEHGGDADGLDRIALAWFG